MNRYEISSTCFGFNCALNALIAGQNITRCDWSKDESGNTRIVYLERYTDGVKYLHFMTAIGNDIDHYSFTTEDILSTNWVIAIDDRIHSNIDLYNSCESMIDSSAPRYVQWKKILSSKPVEGDIFLLRDHNETKMYTYNKNDNMNTFKFISIGGLEKG